MAGDWRRSRHHGTCYGTYHSPRYVYADTDADPHRHGDGGPDHDDSRAGYRDHDGAAARYADDHTTQHTDGDTDRYANADPYADEHATPVEPHSHLYTDDDTCADPDTIAAQAESNTGATTNQHPNSSPSPLKS